MGVFGESGRPLGVRYTWRKGQLIFGDWAKSGRRVLLRQEMYNVGTCEHMRKERTVGNFVSAHKKGMYDNLNFKLEKTTMWGSGGELMGAPIRHCAWTKEGNLGTESASGNKMKATEVIDTQTPASVCLILMVLPRDRELESKMAVTQL